MRREFLPVIKLSSIKLLTAYKLYILYIYRSFTVKLEVISSARIIELQQ